MRFRKKKHQQEEHNTSAGRIDLMGWARSPFIFVCQPDRDEWLARYLAGTLAWQTGKPRFLTIPGVVTLRFGASDQGVQK